MVAKKHTQTNPALNVIPDRIEEILLDTLMPVKITPDMSGVFEQAESYQKQVSALALTQTSNSIAELHAVSRPAVELGLAVLAEAAALKTNLNDIFQASAS